MASDNVQEYVFEIFREKFGPEVLGVAGRFLPQEAFLQLEVRRVTQEMKELARAVQEEFAALGRRVWVQFRS